MDGAGDKYDRSAFSEVWKELNVFQFVFLFQPILQCLHYLAYLYIYTFLLRVRPTAAAAIELLADVYSILFQKSFSTIPQVFRKGCYKQRILADICRRRSIWNIPTR